MPIGNFAAVHSIKRKHAYRAEDAVGSTRKDKQLIHERDQAPKVRVLFAKYDKNRDALLDRDELKSLLVAGPSQRGLTMWGCAQIQGGGRIRRRRVGGWSGAYGAGGSAHQDRVGQEGGGRSGASKD